MPNTLEQGTQRVGSFIDFNPDTPPVTVTLARSEQGISVTIPWERDDSPYALWFTSNSAVRRIPAPPEPPPIPRRAHFYDSHGSVLLIRCWASGHHSNKLGPGNGHLWAQAAIMGVADDVEFDRPNGLKTDITGLRAWLGVRSWRTTTSRADEGSVTVTVRSETQPGTEIGVYKGVAVLLRPGWRMSHEEDRDRVVLHETLHCVTKSDEPLDWHAHEQAHRAVRDLLVLSRWHDESCLVVGAMRHEDVMRNQADNKRHAHRWRDVVVAGPERSAPPKGRRGHLIEYAELGPDGLLRWLELRDEFSRALDPVVSSIELVEATPNTRLAHTGPGLEALGYLLQLRDGVPEKAAARITLRTRFERILEDVGDCLPFDGAGWVERTVEAYNGLKHANRAEPDPVDVFNAWRECVVVVRAWTAVELGVPVDAVKNRLEVDPLRHAYVKVIDD